MDNSILDSFQTSDLYKNNYITYIKGCGCTYPDFLDEVNLYFLEKEFDKTKNTIQKTINSIYNNKKVTDVFVEKKRMSNQISALKKLLEFVETYETSSNTFSVLQINKSTKLSKSRLNKGCAPSRTLKIDGSTSLLEALGGIEKYLQLALRESYFFEKFVVDKRVNDFVNIWNNGEPIPVRYSKKGNYACPNPLIDKDGNKCVRQNINLYSGYTISSGKKSIFQNYRISHLYGNAFDPRYFTNFWNIVLVPEWANCLLEKGNAKSGSTASHVLNTYMAICEKLYSGSIAPLNELEIIKLDTRIKDIISLSPKTSKDIVKGTYKIKMILDKKDSTGLSMITTISITL